MIIVQQAFGPRCMITLPALAADALGSFLASDMKDRFGSSHARLAEVIPFAARLALECLGNSDALYHNVEHSMLFVLDRVAAVEELDGARIARAIGFTRFPYSPSTNEKEDVDEDGALLRAAD